MKKNKTLSTIKELGLTVKQKAFLKAYLDPVSSTFGNGTLSAMGVYDTDDYQTAGSIASENLKKLENPVKILMEAKGLSMDKLLVVLNNGLVAKKIYSSPTEPDREVADHAVRHKFLETAGKWLGVEKSNENNQTTNIQINLTRGE